MSQLDPDCSSQPDPTAGRVLGRSLAVVLMSQFARPVVSRLQAPPTPCRRPNRVRRHDRPICLELRSEPRCSRATVPSSAAPEQDQVQHVRRSPPPRRARWQLRQRHIAHRHWRFEHCQHRRRVHRFPVAPGRAMHPDRAPAMRRRGWPAYPALRLLTFRSAVRQLLALVQRCSRQDPRLADEDHLAPRLH